MKTKFIVILVAQGVIMLCLVVYAAYQQTEAKRQETIAFDIANQAQRLQKQLKETQLIAEHAMKEAAEQRMICEERLQQATKK
ncbi:MAG: hypothetical protein AB7O48_04555 [Cyclobacteriaceae bacterium]